MTDLTEFLLARLDGDEQIARNAVAGDGYAAWDTPTTGVVQVAGGGLDGLVPAPRDSAIHIARWDPARVLAEIDAKRKIIQHAERAHERAKVGPSQVDGAWFLVLRYLALPYADRPDYREEWRP